MNKRRLLKLADLLEADAKNPRGIKFDFLEWGDVENPRRPMSCGTTACAMGLAAISGAFRHTGLKFNYEHQLIEFKGSFGALEAAQRVFDLTAETAEFLFGNAAGLVSLEGAAGERAVAKRLRKFVAGKVAA